MTRMRTKRAAAVEPSTMARNFSSDTPTPDAARPLAEINRHHSGHMPVDTGYGIYRTDG